MKHLLTLLAACAVALSMTSCASKGMPKFDLNTAELAKAANTALLAAELGGVVNTKQAEAARAGGKLLLDFQGTPDDQKLAVLSNVAVDYAEAKGKITPEQAQALREAGTVPLVVPGPANPLLPPAE